jgi:hypothetical protein
VDEGKSVVVGVRSEVVVSRGDGLEVPPVCNDEEEEGRPSNGLAEWKVAARGVNWSESPGPPALVPPPAAALVGWEVDPPVLDEVPGKGELDELGVVGQNCYKIWPGGGMKAVRKSEVEVCSSCFGFRSKMQVRRRTSRFSGVKSNVIGRSNRTEARQAAFPQIARGDVVGGDGTPGRVTSGKKFRSIGLKIMGWNPRWR